MAQNAASNRCTSSVLALVGLQKGRKGPISLGRWQNSIYGIQYEYFWSTGTRDLFATRVLSFNIFSLLEITDIETKNRGIVWNRKAQHMAAVTLGNGIFWVNSLVSGLPHTKLRHIALTSSLGSTWQASHARSSNHWLNWIIGVPFCSLLTMGSQTPPS
jgi:hypothetical protein